MKGKEPLINVWYYLQGMYRYNLYFNRFKFLIRNHIVEQIEERLKVMDSECYESGSCKLCGCMTPALQMCNKPCNKPCYTKMKNKLEWELYKIDRKLENYKNNVG